MSKINYIPHDTARVLLGTVAQTLESLRSIEGVVVAQVREKLEAALEQAQIENDDQERLRPYVDKAEKHYGDSDVEFDGDAIVSEGDGGAYVQCWVFVPRIAGLSDEEDEGDEEDEE